MAEKIRLHMDVRPATEIESEYLQMLNTTFEDPTKVALGLLRAATKLAQELQTARELMEALSEIKRQPEDNSLAPSDLDRLDLYNPYRGFDDIVNACLLEAGGNAGVALRRLVRRGMAIDDELDSLRLEHHDLQAANNEPTDATPEEIDLIRSHHDKLADASWGKSALAFPSMEAANSNSRPADGNPAIQ